MGFALSLQKKKQKNPTTNKSIYNLWQMLPVHLKLRTWKDHLNHASDAASHLCSVYIYCSWTLANRRKKIYSEITHTTQKHFPCVLGKTMGWTATLSNDLRNKNNTVRWNPDVDHPAECLVNTCWFKRRTHGENKIVTWTETCKPLGSTVKEIAFWNETDLMLNLLRRVVRKDSIVSQTLRQW